MPFFNHPFQAQLHGKDIKWMRTGQKVEHQFMLLLRWSQKKKKKAHLKWFRADLCAIALCEEHKSHYCCTRMFWSTVWPGVKTFESVWLSDKKTWKPLCPTWKCQLSRWILWPVRLRGVLGRSRWRFGGCAQVRLCKRRGCLHGGRGLLTAPLVWVTPYHEA